MTYEFNYYCGTEAEQFTFYRIPKALFKDERFKGLSSDAKLLYGLMLDRMSLSIKNDWLDELDRAYIYYTMESAMENLVATGVSKKKIRIIYNGVQPIQLLCEEEKKKVFESFGIECGTKIVSIVARLEEFKGHEYFIDTAKIVAEKGYDAKFVIAGTGSRKEFLEQYAKEQQTDNVVFLDFVSNVSDLNNITYIQVNASLYEAFGLAVVEAMRVGVPAVVSGYGGNLEVVENNINGFVINGQDSTAFAERIIQLLDDEKLYSEMSANSVKRYSENFTAYAMTKNTEKFYDEILGGTDYENKV